MIQLQINGKNFSSLVYLDQIKLFLLSPPTSMAELPIKTDEEQTIVTGELTTQTETIKLTVVNH